MIQHDDPTEHNEDLYNFTQQQGKNSIQVPIDYKLGDTGTYPGTQNKVILSVIYHNLKYIF